MTTLDRIQIAATRLNVTYATALRITQRDVGTCKWMVDHFTAAWDAAKPGSCCKPVIENADHYPMACEHLRRLWDANTYHQLAIVNAPADSFGCEGCHGSGKFYGRGYVENGVFKGTIGQCFRCVGKGYQSPADRLRNSNYDNYVRKVYA